jgi:hypothetical protein
MILGQQQTGRMRCELSERDPTDIAALLQLGHVLGDGIIKAELVVPNGDRQHGRVEHLAERSEVEQ